MERKKDKELKGKVKHNFVGIQGEREREENSWKSEKESRGQ